MRQSKKMEAGNFIRRWRKARGLNQAQLGEAVGLEANTISRIETGVNAYTRDSLEKIAKTLGVAPYQLLLGPPNSANDDLTVLIATLSDIERQRAAVILRAIAGPPGEQAPSWEARRPRARPQQGPAGHQPHRRAS